MMILAIVINSIYQVQKKKKCELKREGKERGGGRGQMATIPYLCRAVLLHLPTRGR
jgi:hypothetical protein